MKHAVHVLRRREEFGDLFLLNFAWDAPPPRAGQFLMVKPERSGVFLARPLSVAFVGDGEIGFLVAKRGRGTEELARMLPGDRAELTGPMGKAWEELLPRPQSLAKPVALVGGGVGIAPLLALQAENEREGKGFLFHIYAGFRTKPDLPFLEQGPESVTATEDGSSGKPGRITDHLEPGRYAAVCTCGPEAMMKAVADKC
ncbi:MAG: hypothetical protein FWD94_05920, partial [Treponema sp.]|nr:hypothetical protein [Treponema sp.]